METYTEPREHDRSPDIMPPSYEGERWVPPRPAVIEALLRNWLLVVLPAVVLAAVGVAIAFSRPATYTSEAQLSVGKANPTSPAFGGFVPAAASLAAVYSRAVGVPGVVNGVASQLHVSPGVISARLSATPIQDSPIIRVIGKAPDASTAEAIANAGAAQLTNYVTNFNRSNPDATRLLGEYQGVARHKATVDSQLANLKRAQSSNPGNAGINNLVATDSAVSSALGVRLQAISAAYNASLSGQAATDVLSPLSSAKSATSNRSSQAQTLGGIGLLAGLVIGVALAMWRANRLLRRRLLG